ncbi:MAG: hypothetical protein LBC40_05480, partial [Dysgonamonadaceae bacterium]|nr:hypothetical protein [Dysgonamonadaceae bacterium]
MKQENRLSFTMYMVLAVWILGQIGLIIYFWGKPQGSDPGVYMRWARECFEAGKWYPMDKHVYSSYICTGGLINFMILQLKLFGTLNVNMIFNLLMNIAIATEIYFLGNRFFSKKTASYAVIIWCFLYSNLMVVVSAGTEIPFLFLALSAFCLCLHPRMLFIAAAGVLLALANWIRPLASVFLAGIIIYMLLKKYEWKHYLCLLVFLVTVVFTIGKATEKQIGYFVYQSTTFGVNLITTANDRAYGGNATSLFRDSTSTAFIEHLENYTFMQRDSIWRARSFQWISAHPARYGMLYLKKLAGLYVEDSWSDRPIFGGDGFVDSYVVGGKVEKSTFMIRAMQMGLKSLTYYLALIAFCYAMVTTFRRKMLTTGKAILLFILL